MKSNNPTESFDATVLFVDDEQDILDIFEICFKDTIRKMFLTTSPKEAIRISGENRIDLAVLDLKTPEMDGLTLLKELRNVHPGLKSIFLTGFGTKDSVQEAMRMDAFDFLDKPFDNNTLRSCVQGALRKIVQERIHETALSVAEMRIEAQKLGRKD